MEATPAQAGEDDADAAAVTTPLDAALPLILPFTSLQCKGRAQATSKIVRESVVVDELDARPLYSKLGAAKATALLPSLLEKHRLTSLNLEFCRAASILDAVAETQHTLRQLNLNGVPDADPATVARLLGSCSRLEVVGLFRHVRLGDDALAALPSSLRELSVSGCSLISDAGVKALVEHAPHLHFLDVTRCPQLTDASLMTLASLKLTGLVCYANASLSAYGRLRAFDLRRLDCTGSRGVDGNAIAKIARAAAARLEILNLSWCVAVDDEAPLALGECCPNLTWLSLHGNRHVTDTGIDALSRGCLKLTSLDVSGCSQVTDYLRREGLLVGKFPRVETWRLHT
jgi:hypothetical protein